MTDRRDDDFRIRPSAPKNRGQSFVSKVLKQAGKASSGKSAVRRPGGSSKSAGSGQRPGSRLGRGHGGALRGGEAHVHVAACDHQDAAAQSAPSQPAVACQAPALYRARWCGPRWRVGPSLRAADRCRRPRCVQERCADDRHHFRFILSPEDGAELEDLRTYTRHLMGRMEADLARASIGWPSITGTPTTRTRTSSCAGATTPAKTSSSRATTSPMGSAIAPPNWRPNGWARAPSWRSSRPCGARWIRSGGRAWIAPEARGRRRWHGACRTAQRTPTATPASAADRQVAAFAAPGPGRRGPARHVDRPQRCGKDPARPGRARRHHPHHAAGHARRAARTGGVRAWGRWPNHPRPRGREGAGRRTARPGLSGHRRRGRHGPLRCAQRPRRAGELSDRRCGGGKEIG